MVKTSQFTTKCKIDCGVIDPRHLGLSNSRNFNG